ncbi:lupeol synthase [Tanacetum coccineum]
MFGSVYNYITLRLLGEEADSCAEDMTVVKGRKWILDHGGAVGTPSWGKFWLTEDLYYPHPLVQDMLWGILHNVAEPILTRWPFSKLREKAIKVAMEHVHYNDECSRYLGIGIVVKVLSLIATWVEDPNGDAYKRHLARIPDYFWVAEDGMKIQSFGSQMWDASFAIQAILSSNLAEEYSHVLKKSTQLRKILAGDESIAIKHLSLFVRDNPPGDYGKMYRHATKGAWTFSMQDNGLQVSDCTAEGLKVALIYSQISPELVGEKLETERLYDAVNVILSLQSLNGGFPAWEPQRAYSWLEETEVKSSILTPYKAGSPFLPLVEPEATSLPLVGVGLSTSQPFPYTVEDDQERSKKNKNKKPSKAAKGVQGKGKGKKAYANAEPSYAPKPKNLPPPKKDNPAKGAICHHCGEVGH